MRAPPAPRLPVQNSADHGPAGVGAQVEGDADVHAAGTEVPVHHTGAARSGPAVPGSPRGSRPGSPARRRNPPSRARTRTPLSASGRRVDSRDDSPAPSSRTRQSEPVRAGSGTGASVDQPAVCAAAGPSSSVPRRPARRPGLVARRGRRRARPCRRAVRRPSRRRGGTRMVSTIASSMPSTAAGENSRMVRDVAGGVHHVLVAEADQQRALAGLGTSFIRAPTITIAQVPSDPDERAGHVETVLGQQVGQVVAGDLARDASEFGPEAGQVGCAPAPAAPRPARRRAVREYASPGIGGPQPGAVAVSCAPSAVTTSSSATWSRCGRSAPSGCRRRRCRCAPPTVARFLEDGSGAKREPVAGGALDLRGSGPQARRRVPRPRSARPRPRCRSGSDAGRSPGRRRGRPRCRPWTCRRRG